jgi:dTDP-glucose 4,6-dehydratase
MYKILLIGSNSCAGSAFADNLIKSKKFNILLASRQKEKQPHFLPYKFNNTNKDYCTFKKIDLNNDSKLLNETINTFKPDYIINFASQSMVGQSWDQPNDWLRTNIMGLTNLLEVIRRYKKLKLYIHFSTPEVLGDFIKSDEDNEIFNPSTPYAVSRAAGDMMLKIYGNQYHIPYIITRATNIYGPGQQLYRIIPKTIYSILKNKKIPLHGGGESSRSFLHVNDMSEALMNLLFNYTVGKCYYITNNNYVKIKDLVKLIFEIMNCEYDELVYNVGDRLGKDKDYKLSLGNMQKIGWEAKLPLKEGLKQVINWMNIHKHNITNEDQSYIHLK